MAVIHNWSRQLPENCELHFFRVTTDQIVLGLYCSDYLQELRVNTINGKIELGDRRKPELKGKVEMRKNFFIVSCYQGLGKILWNRVERGLNTKVLCKMEICIIATMNKDRELEVKIVDKRNEELDRIRIANVYDFHIGASDELIILSTTGFTEESNTVTIIDPATVSIVEHVPGFGGFVLSSSEHVFVYGYKEGGMITKVFTGEGEEVLETEGIPVLPPYNPFAYPLIHHGMFSTENIIIMDRNEIKVFDPYDFSLIYTALKPPLTRGVINVDINEPSMIVYGILTGKPYLIKYDHAGVVKWISHVLRDFVYALTSDKIIAMYIRSLGGETRIYRIAGNTLIHEESFAPHVFPLLVRGDTVILTDSRIISSYSIE